MAIATRRANNTTPVGDVVGYKRPKNPAGRGSLFDPAIMKRALVDALRKLDPRLVAKNPVMFVVEVGSVEEIRDAGINVASTLNIRHLESLNDAVAEITGVRDGREIQMMFFPR
jgi:hypothetical protein